MNDPKDHPKIYVTIPEWKGKLCNIILAIQEETPINIGIILETFPKVSDNLTGFHWALQNYTYLLNRIVSLTAYIIWGEITYIP